MPVKRISKAITDFSLWTLSNGMQTDGKIDTIYHKNLLFSAIDGVSIRSSPPGELRYKFHNYFNPNKPKFSIELTWKTPSNYSATARYVLFAFGFGSYPYNNTTYCYLVFYHETNGRLYIKGYKDNISMQFCFRCHDGNALRNDCELCHTESFIEKGLEKLKEEKKEASSSSKSSD